jgi:hypothetical protein
MFIKTLNFKMPKASYSGFFDWTRKRQKRAAEDITSRLKIRGN